MRTRGRRTGILALLAVFGALLAQGESPERVGEVDGEVELRRRVAELEGELERERAERSGVEAGLRRRIATLERELTAVSEERLAREREWLSYTRLFAGLAPGGLPAELMFLPQLPPEELELLLLDEPAQRESASSRSDRDREVFVALRSLLALEGIDGFELLESGRVSGGAVGPVVFRTIDDRGRSIGSLVAERLRLEGSRAARSLSLVLEEGFERASGRRHPFEGAPAGAERGGVRRIHLGRIDPEPWIRALPELFRSVERSGAIDDGRWDPLALRHALNELLERESLGGTWRLRALGGVVEDELRDVWLERHDGRAILRQVAADRLRIRIEEGTLQLVLEDGAQLSEGRKLPFLDGRYRIYLPRADVEAWRGAGLPGLVGEPSAALGRAHPAR